MSVDRPELNRRILVIDDLAEIHAVFRKLLCPEAKGSELGLLESSLFGETDAPPSNAVFEVDTAFQGEEGLALVGRALAAGRPYAMAFVDMRMPPGWDGLQTIEAIWREAPDVEIVICSAYADHTDADIVRRLGASDRVLFLRKPFDPVEVRQLARALTEKWTLRQQARLHKADLERRVATRTRELSAANLRLVEEIAQKQAINVELQRAQQLETVGRLAAGVAGELDTSLRSLLSAVEDAGAHVPVLPLKQDLATSSARYLIDAMRVAGQATRHMAGLVRGFMKLATENPVPRATIDLNEAVGAVAEVMRESIHACAQLQTDLGPLPPIPCSPGDINLVLLALVDSAVQAVDAAKQKTGCEGRISISTWAEAGYGTIAISDSGERLRQGLGVARAIIVEQHGGQLSLEQLADGGSTVLIRLPLVAAEARPPA